MKTQVFELQRLAGSYRGMTAQRIRPCALAREAHTVNVIHIDTTGPKRKLVKPGKKKVRKITYR